MFKNELPSETIYFSMNFYNDTRYFNTNFHRRMGADV